MSKSVLLALAPALLALPATAQTVHVVDDDGGVDFTDIQSAIDAAADGDVILVRSGSYFSANVDAKGVTVVADQGHSVTINGQCSVTNLAPNQAVNFTQLEIIGAPAVSLSVNDGPILIEDCFLRGEGVPIFLSASGAEVFSCADVTFANCFIQALTPQSSDPGLEAANSNVNVFHCLVTGASGLTQLPGGPGAQFSGCELFAAQSDFVGGQGGDGTPADIFVPCSNGGQGGSGLTISNGTGCNALVRLQGVDTIGGAGGPATDPGCTAGPSGLGLDHISGNVIFLNTTGTDTHGLTADFPVRAGTPANLQITGQPGELSFVMYSTGTAPTFFPFLNGVSIPDNPLQSVFTGVIPVSGALSVPVNVALPPGADFLGVYLQTAYWTPIRFLVGTPLHAVTLDPSF